MNIPKPWVFSILLVGLIIIPNAYASIQSTFTSNSILDRSNIKDYLTSLQGIRGTAVGCLTLPQRELELLVFGDSHAYAGIDHNELQSFSPNYRIGACVLPVAFLESLGYLLDVLDAIIDKPEVILLFTTLRQFLQSDAKTSWLEQRQEILFDDRYRENKISLWQKI